MSDLRVISIKCKDHAGVVNRITALFFSRNLNIHKLTVCEIEEEGISEIFIEILYDEERAKHIVQLLSKIIDIIEVADITEQIQLGRQHCMLRVKTDMDKLKLGFDDIHASFLKVKDDWIYLEIVDTVANTTKTIEKLQRLGEVKFARSGRLFLQ